MSLDGRFYQCKESYRALFPPLARLVKKTLYLGPYRPLTEIFTFSCDNAEGLAKNGKLC